MSGECVYPGHLSYPGILWTDLAMNDKSRGVTCYSRLTTHDSRSQSLLQISYHEPAEIFIEICVFCLCDFFYFARGDVFESLDEQRVECEEVDAVVVVFYGREWCGKFRDDFAFEFQRQVVEVCLFHNVRTVGRLIAGSGFFYI